MIAACSTAVAVGASIRYRTKVSADLLDEVQDVVEGADQGVDVLAIERRDERRLQPVADVVADLVAAMLGRADLGRASLGLVVGPEHRLEEPGAAEDVRGVLDEQVEEPHVARDQAETQGRSSVDDAERQVRGGRRRIAAGLGGLVGSDRRGATRVRVPRRHGACAILGPMDWIFVGFVGLLAIALAIAVGVAIDRDRRSMPRRDGRSTRRRRGRIGRRGAIRGPICRRSSRRLRDRLDASEFELDQQVRNASYLADLMGVGIVRLDDGGNVELANAAAHILAAPAAGHAPRPDGARDVRRRAGSRS